MDFSNYAAVVGTYLALDLDNNGVIDDDFVRVFEMTQPEKFALTRAQRLQKMGSLAPADGNHDKKLTLKEFTQYFSGKTGIRRNFEMCTAESGKGRGGGGASVGSPQETSTSSHNDDAATVGKDDGNVKAWEEQTIEKVDQFLIIVLAASFVVMQVAIYMSKMSKKGKDTPPKDKTKTGSKSSKKVSQGTGAPLPDDPGLPKKPGVSAKPGGGANTDAEKEQLKKEQRARDLAKKREQEALKEAEEQRRMEEKAAKQKKLSEDKKRKEEEKRAAEAIRRKEEEVRLAEAMKKKAAIDAQAASDAKALAEAERKSARDKKKEERRRVLAEQKAAELLAEQQRQAERKTMALLAEQKALEEQMRRETEREAFAARDRQREERERLEREARNKSHGDPQTNGTPNAKGADKAQSEQGSRNHLEQLNARLQAQDRKMDDLLSSDDTSMRTSNASQGSRKTSSAQDGIPLPIPRPNCGDSIQGWESSQAQGIAPGGARATVKAQDWETFQAPAGSSSLEPEPDAVWLHELPAAGSQWRPGMAAPPISELLSAGSQELPAGPAGLDGEMPVLGDPFAAAAANPWGTGPSDPFAGPNSLFAMGFGNDPTFTPQFGNGFPDGNGTQSLSPQAGVIGAPGSNRGQQDKQQMSRLRHIWS